MLRFLIIFLYVCVCRINVLQQNGLGNVSKNVLSVLDSYKNNKMPRESLYFGESMNTQAKMDFTCCPYLLAVDILVHRCDDQSQFI